MSPDEAADWIESRGVRWRQETGADWVVTTAADVVGRVGFRTLHLDEGRAEVAYWIALRHEVNASRPDPSPCYQNGPSGQVIRTG